MCDTKRDTHAVARMAKSADAADLKSAGPKGLWGFKSPSGHQSFYFSCHTSFACSLNPTATLAKVLRLPHRTQSIKVREFLFGQVVFATKADPAHIDVMRGEDAAIT